MHIEPITSSKQMGVTTWILVIPVISRTIRFAPIECMRIVEPKLQAMLNAGCF